MKRNGTGKARLMEAGFLWIKPENSKPFSGQRIVASHDKARLWFVSGMEAADKLADELLGPESGRAGRVKK